MSDHDEMGSSDTQWLVKSSGRILGPYTMPKVIELLRTREISLLDETSAPQRRWQTIQYHEAFKETVANLRKVNTSELTEATWTPTGITSNLTQTLTDVSDPSLTEDLTDDLGFTNTASEIIVHNVQEEQAARVNKPSPSGRFQPQQGHSTAIQRQVDRTTRGLWFFSVLVMVAVAGYIYQKRNVQSSRVEKLNPGEFKQSVMANIQAGQYAEALKSMKAYFPDPSLAGDMSIYYGSLLVQLEGQTVLARRLLNSVIAAHDSDVKQAYTSLGIAEMLDGQLETAQGYFDKALAMDPRFSPALLNKAALALQKSEYAAAKALTLKTLVISPMLAEAMLTLSEAQLFLFKSGGNLAELTRVKQMIRDFQSKQLDYAPELGFYDVYFSYLTKEANLEDRLRDYLDQDPELTDDYRHNVFIYRGNLNWKILARYCEQLSGKLGSSARVTAFLASCYSHEQRWDQARRQIEAAVQQAPKDALIQAWFSYILRESGEGEQASVVLSRSTELNRSGEFLLPVLLQARFCANSQVIDCAQASWQHLYERNMDYPPAVSGLAWVNADKGFHSAARTNLDKGLAHAPDYIPLLLLKQKAEREGWYAAH